jgi:hypothetical protein
VLKKWHQILINDSCFLSAFVHVHVFFCFVLMFILLCKLCKKMQSECSYAATLSGTRAWGSCRNLHYQIPDCTMLEKCHLHLSHVICYILL